MEQVRTGNRQTENGSSTQASVTSYYWIISSTPTAALKALLNLSHLHLQTVAREQAETRASNNQQMSRRVIKDIGYPRIEEEIMYHSILCIISDIILPKHCLDKSSSVWYTNRFQSNFGTRTNVYVSKHELKFSVDVCSYSSNGCCNREVEIIYDSQGVTNALSWCRIESKAVCEKLERLRCTNRVTLLFVTVESGLNGNA